MTRASKQALRARRKLMALLKHQLNTSQKREMQGAFRNLSCIVVVSGMCETERKNVGNWASGAKL